MRSHQLLAPFAGVALAACNGHDELCDRQYSNVTFIGTHDSAFVGITPTHNQFISVTDQLDLGVRFLQAQTHDKDGGIEMCHTFCLELDEGSLADYLQEVSDFMADNTDEVVTLLLTNGDNIGLDKFDEAFDSTGLKDLAFRPDHTLAKDEWPILQEMIDAGSRLVVFMDANADQSQVDYIIPEFDYFWETQFGITDADFPTCDVDRPSGGDPAKLMGIMNHMLNNKIGSIVFPKAEAAETTNSIDSIQKQVDLCIGQHGVQPNVVLLDWVNIGQAVDEQLALNGLS